MSLKPEPLWNPIPPNKLEEIMRSVKDSGETFLRCKLHVVPAEVLPPGCFAIMGYPGRRDEWIYIYEQPMHNAASMSWPKIFQNPALIQLRTHDQLLADGVSAWGLCQAGTKPVPENFGEVMVAVGKKLGVPPGPSSLMAHANAVLVARTRAQEADTQASEQTNG